MVHLEKTPEHDLYSEWTAGERGGGLCTQQPSLPVQYTCLSLTRGGALDEGNAPKDVPPAECAGEVCVLLIMFPV